MTPLQSPFAQFFDRTGAPLSNGSIFVGAAGQNPETAPITVYWDEAGTQPAAQPIRTMNGYPVRSGTPAAIFLTGDYSLTVKDSAGRLVFYAAKASEFSPDARLRADLAASSGARLVGLKRSAADAVAHTIADVVTGTPISLFEFMTDAQIADVRAGTLVHDCSDALAAAVAAGGRVYCPAGKYRMPPRTFTGIRRLTLEGAASALMSSGLTYATNTTFVFDGSAAGTDGLVFDDFVGLTLRNILITMRRGGSGGGRGLVLTAGHLYTLDGVSVDMLVGGGGAGIQLGGGNGATATFVGNIQRCKVFGGTAASFFVNFGTSLSFTGCYQIGGSWTISGLVYSSLRSCASEASPAGRYGYEITGCSNLVLDTCGAEANNKGAFYVNASFNITLTAPYGATNNLSGDATIGDLVQMDATGGACTNIAIDNPTALGAHGATTANIYANAGNGYCTVTGINFSSLPQGVKGHSLWLASKLTLVGYGEQIAWTPTLSGWATTGPEPTVSGHYVKRGSMVMFTVTVTPGAGGTISATRPASVINGLPFAPMAGAGAQVDGNAASYGSAAVSPVGTIYPQTTGVINTTVTVTGMLMLA